MCRIDVAVVWTKIADFFAGQNVMRDVGATLNTTGRYRNSVFDIFERVVSPRNPSGPVLNFLLPGLSVCRISLINSFTFFWLLFGIR